MSGSGYFPPEWAPELQCPCGDKWSSINVGWCQCGALRRPAPDARKMTREDLGLPPKEVRIWSSKDWERQKSPYKFWLGADA